ncbi:MAG: exopolyphosphatase [Gammaproteobacteria bacterium]
MNPNQHHTQDNDTFAEASLLAALDLGSNSFHIAIGRQTHGQIKLLDKLQEKVQLAAGLTENNEIDEAAQARAIDCLIRFRQRLDGLSPGSVRIVGTNTFRVAKNAYQFIRRAEAVLGHPIEVISGREEARLIYLGIAHTCSDDKNRRLVIDIGGGSTECIIGSRFEPILLESLHMGCVRYKRFFPNNQLTPGNLSRAINAARLEVEQIKEAYLEGGWQECMGSSGTIKSIQQACEKSGLSNKGITRSALNTLREQLLRFDSLDNVDIPGVKPDRRSIFVPGFAILLGIFDQLGIDNMHFADGALREGVLYDLLGRLHHEDVRDRTIKTLQQSYDVDVAHANRVTLTAHQLATLATHCPEGKKYLTEDAIDLLTKACATHEIGLAVSHSQFHRHSAYLLEHSDLPGFSHQEQIALAALVQNHRRKMVAGKSKNTNTNATGFPKKTRLILTIILRLAVLLNRSRVERALPITDLSITSNHCRLSFQPNWLTENPLIQLDLNLEQAFLLHSGITLDIQ